MCDLTEMIDLASVWNIMYHERDCTLLQWRIPWRQMGTMEVFYWGGLPNHIYTNILYHEIPNLDISQARNNTQRKDRNACHSLYFYHGNLAAKLNPSPQSHLTIPQFSAHRGLVAFWRAVAMAIHEPEKTNAKGEAIASIGIPVAKTG